jgi:hypothetical protein
MKVLLRDLKCVDLQIYTLVLLRVLENLLVLWVHQLVSVDDNLDGFDLVLTKILFLLYFLRFVSVMMTTKCLSLVGI